MECIVCGIDAETGAPIWDVFDLEFASVAPAMCRSADGACYMEPGAHPCVRRALLSPSDLQRMHILGDRLRIDWGMLTLPCELSGDGCLYVDAGAAWR